MKILVSCTKSLLLFFVYRCYLRVQQKEQQLLVYKINDEYFSLDKECVERVYLRENRPIFYLNDNVIIELDNKKSVYNNLLILSVLILVRKLVCYLRALK